MCDQPGTSREHVPPRCLFPEWKDIGGNYRKNLITVPSCEDHNTAKSSDDEFLMVSLAGIVGNNSIGYRHKFSKVNRAIYKSSFALLKQAMKDQRWDILEFSPNKFLDVVWGTPDHERLNRCFDRIARGLYLHRFGRQFRGTTKVMLGYLQSDAPNPAEFQRFVRDKLALELQGKSRLGDNPEVFSFQFTEPDQFGLISLHLQFYGGLDIYTGLIPQATALPFNLGIELMNRGIHTVFLLGEREYHFNVAKSEVNNPR